MANYLKQKGTELNLDQEARPVIMVGYKFNFHLAHETPPFEMSEQQDKHIMSAG